MYISNSISSVNCNAVISVYSSYLLAMYNERANKC